MFPEKPTRWKKSGSTSRNILKFLWRNEKKSHIHTIIRKYHKTDEGTRHSILAIIIIYILYESLLR